MAKPTISVKELSQLSNLIHIADEQEEVERHQEEVKLVVPDVENVLDNLSLKAVKARLTKIEKLAHVIADTKAAKERKAALEDELNIIFETAKASDEYQTTIRRIANLRKLAGEAGINLNSEIVSLEQMAEKALVKAFQKGVAARKETIEHLTAEIAAGEEVAAEIKSTLGGTK